MKKLKRKMKERKERNKKTRRLRKEMKDNSGKMYLETHDGSIGRSTWRESES